MHIEAKYSFIKLFFRLTEHRGSFDDEYSPQVDSNQLLISVGEWKQFGLMDIIFYTTIKGEYLVKKSLLKRKIISPSFKTYFWSCMDTAT